MDTIAGHSIYVGMAAWALPIVHAAAFPCTGSHPMRYAGRISAVEVNPLLYKPRRPETYDRWAASVPDSLRFAVKAQKEISHQQLELFLAGVLESKNNLEFLLVQLPPTLAFDARVAEPFFAGMSEQFTESVVCEPRHKEWFSGEAGSVLTAFWGSSHRRRSRSCAGGCAAW